MSDSAAGTQPPACEAVLVEPPDGPARFDRRCHPGVALTAAPLGVGGAFAYAAYAILVNLLIAIGASTQVVRADLTGLYGGLSALVGVDVHTVAIAAFGVLTVLAYLLILAPLPYLARSRGVPFSQFVGMRRVSPLLVAGLALVVLVFGISVSAVYAVVVSAFHVNMVGNAAPIAKAFGASPFGVAMAFFAVAVVAPVAEECAFRGVVFAGMRSRWGQWPAVLASGALFGVIHLDPLIMVPTALLGMALAWAFSSTRSLWASIFAHSLYNSLTLAVAFSALSRLR